MSKVELSDAELIATLKATAWRFHVRLTARNAELDELREVVGRVKEMANKMLLPYAKESNGSFPSFWGDKLLEALAPAQKEAPVEGLRCVHGILHGLWCNSYGGWARNCGVDLAAPHDPTAATEAREQAVDALWNCCPDGITKGVVRMAVDAILAASARKE